MKPVTVLFAAGLMVAAIPALALELPESMAQPSLHLGFTFGGASPAPLAQRLAYRLQLDSRWRDESDPIPAFIALEFTNTGLEEAKLAGVPLRATSLMLAQAEGEEAGSPGLKFWEWGLPQWGFVVAGGIIAATLVTYEDPTKHDPPPSAASDPTVGCDDGSTLPPEVIPPGTVGGGCI